MNNRDLKFIVFSTLVSILSISIIIASFILDNKQNQIKLILIAFYILATQKIIEIIFIKKTRKISIAILIILIFSIYYLINK